MRIAQVALVSVAATLFAVGAHAATFQVTNTDDTGSGSLRDAIEQSNTTLGVDKIVFDISGAGPYVIQPKTQLPTVVEAVDIDGASQDGIVLEGGRGFVGIKILSGGSTIAGLEIRGFFGGVSIGDRRGSEFIASGNTLRDNQIHSNERSGVDIYSGGPTTASGNTIENNDIHSNIQGLSLQAVNEGTSSDNNIRGNQIHDNVRNGMGLLVIEVETSGTTASGNTFRGNRIYNNGGPDGEGGLWLGALGVFENGGNTTTLSGNTVEDNHIHDNAPHGLWLVAGLHEGGDALVTDNRIANNTIEANAGWGLEILGAPVGLGLHDEDATIVDNTIAGNTFAGNGLGEIHWPEGQTPTAVQATTWGTVKAQEPGEIPSGEFSLEWLGR